MLKFLCLLLFYPFSCCCLDHSYDTGGIFSTVDEGISSIRHGDFFHAYTNLTTQAFKNNTHFDDFLLFISKIPTLYNNSSINLGLAKVDEKEGIYEGEICTKEGEKMAIRFDLKKGGKRWLIESIVVYPINPTEMPLKSTSATTLKHKILKLFGLK